MPTLSLVIPAFNESQRLPRTLDLISRYFALADVDWEVIVVDDGSTDGTASLVRERAASWSRLRLIEQGRNRGKGAAVKAGIAASRAPLVAFTDADLAAPIEQIDLLIDDLADSEIAIVSRALPGARLGNRQSFARETMGRLYAKLTEVFLLRGVPDAQCGLKVFRSAVADEIFSAVLEDGILFDTESLLIAALRGFRVSQRPAVWSHDADSRIRFSLSMAIDVALSLIRLKLRHRVVWPVQVLGPTRPAANEALAVRLSPGTRQQVDEATASVS